MRRDVQDRPARLRADRTGDAQGEGYGVRSSSSAAAAPPPGGFPSPLEREVDDEAGEDDSVPVMMLDRLERRSSSEEDMLRVRWDLGRR